MGSIARLRAEAGGVVILEPSGRGMRITVADWPPLADLDERHATQDEGLKGSSTGAGIGGAFGEAAFKSLAPELFKSLGSFAGPLGAIAGGVIGGLAGGLLKKTKTGSATLSIGADGVQVGSTGGNSASRRAAASAAGDSISDALNKIAEQLGGTADGPLSVSVGVRNKKFKVDPTGRGRTKGAGVLDFGDDQEAAARAAILDALTDGVIKGISDGAQRLLKVGKDVDRALQKALGFESVRTRLKAIDNPLGAAIDTVDKEFGRLKVIFGEAGASTQEYADLERLYGIERGKVVRDVIEQTSGSLKSLLADLTTGNSALSLRDRLGSARSAYDPLAARVAAGDVTAYSQFTDAARELLEIQRQFSGSQSGYFDLLGQVRGLTQGELDRQTSIANAATNRDSPFAANPLGKGDSVAVVDAIDAQTAAMVGVLTLKLDAVNANLGAIIQGRAISNDNLAGLLGGANYY